jgi:hypothetical protein
MHRIPSAEEFLTFVNTLKPFAVLSRSHKKYTFIFNAPIPYIISPLFTKVESNTYLLKRFPECVQNLGKAEFPVPSFPLPQAAPEICDRVPFSELRPFSASDDEDDYPDYPFRVSYIPVKSNIRHVYRKCDAFSNATR